MHILRVVCKTVKIWWHRHRVLALRKFQVKFRDMLTLEPEDCCAPWHFRTCFVRKQQANAPQWCSSCFQHFWFLLMLKNCCSCNFGFQVKSQSTFSAWGAFGGHGHLGCSVPTTEKSRSAWSGSSIGCLDQWQWHFKFQVSMQWIDKTDSVYFVISAWILNLRAGDGKSIFKCRPLMFLNCNQWLSMVINNYIIFLFIVIFIPDYFMIRMLLGLLKGHRLSANPLVICWSTGKVSKRESGVGSLG